MAQSRTTPRSVFSALALVCAACSPTSGDEQAGDTSESSTGPSTSSSESSTSETDTGADEGWQTSLQAGPELGALMSVWGPHPEQVFAVGGQLEPAAATIMRFDGLAWTQESTPANTPMLNWVYGVDGRTWTVGQAGTILVRDDAGGSWIAESSPSDRVLWGLWGASADELWAVGGDGLGDAPVLLRRDGGTGSWESVALPDLGVAGKGLFKIWGTSASDIWIVGDVGSSLHWDGGAWTAHPSGGGVDLISLWGSQSEGIVAVGGRSSGRIARLEGTTWTEQVLELPGLNGVWVDPNGPITAVGVQGKILAVDPGAFTYAEQSSGTIMVLHSVFGFAGGPRFAVGGSLLMPPPYLGIVLRSD